MTPSRVRSCIATALILAVATVGAVAVGAEADSTGARIGSPAAGPVATMSARTDETPTQKTQHITVRWSGGDKLKDYAKSAVVPGIGNVTLVCKPSSTMVRLYTQDRDAETQMWMSKYEDKDNHAVVAVKTARVYRYANANDDGTGGTGYYSHEGLNQQTPIEDYSSGYMNGIISQRPGRNLPANGVAPKPVTSFKLNWYWTGFRNPEDYRFCKIDAVFKTKLDTRLGINWHGEPDASQNVLQVTRLPAIGDLLIRCETNDDGEGGVQSIGLVPDERDAKVYVEYVTGEGRVEDHVETFSNTYDPETGRLGPFLLPRNGMMRLFFTVGGTQRAFIVSSYYVTNNARSPGLNLCEVAASAY